MVHVLPRISRWFLFGLGYQWIEVIGQLPSVDEVPVLIVSPHCTVVDPFIMGIFTVPSVVTRGENRNMPLFGSKCNLYICACKISSVISLTSAEMFEILQTIFVHRGEQGSRSDTVSEICRRAESHDEWPYILLFPEGVYSS